MSASSASPTPATDREYTALCSTHQLQLKCYAFCFVLFVLYIKVV